MRVIAGASGVLSAQFTRPSDTTAYTAGDVISNSTTAAEIMDFGALHPNSRGAIVASALLIDSAAPATKLDSELFLFDTPPGMQNDNEAWAPTDSEMLNCLGVIAFPTANFKTCGANGLTQVIPIGLPVRALSDGGSLYGILVARNAYTPVSDEVFKVVLGILQD